MISQTNPINSHLAGPGFEEIGDMSKIPKGHFGTDDRAPGDWATLLWESPWKVAREGEKPKGEILPILFGQAAKRELMARSLRIRHQAIHLLFYA